MRNNMTSEEWINRDYSKYPEEVESINKHRVFTEITEEEENEEKAIWATFRFGDEVYGTKLKIKLGTREELKKEYLDRGIDLAYDLFKEKLFKVQLRHMKNDIQYFWDTLFKMQFKSFGYCIIEEIDYTPKINFFKHSYTISRWKKDPKNERRIQFNSVDDIIEDIKNDYYDNTKVYLISDNRIKAAFCQLLDYLNKDNETE